MINTSSGRTRIDERTAFLERQGYCILRFSNREVLQSADAVIDQIHALLIAHVRES